MTSEEIEESGEVGDLRNSIRSIKDELTNVKDDLVAFKSAVSHEIGNLLSCSSPSVLHLRLSLYS